MTIIRWAKMSRDDLARINRHYREISPALADEINQRIVSAASFIANLPLAGPATARGDRRKWRIAQTPYVLFYRVTAAHVRVLRVIHGAREITGRL